MRRRLGCCGGREQTQQPFPVLLAEQQREQRLGAEGRGLAEFCANVVSESRDVPGVAVIVECLGEFGESRRLGDHQSVQPDQFCGVQPVNDARCQRFEGVSIRGVAADRRGEAAHHRGENAGFAVKVTVDGAFGHTGSCRELVDRCLAVSVLEEDGQGSLEDLRGAFNPFAHGGPAALAHWNLPIVYVIINNQLGMGTTVDKASAEPELYKRGSAYRMASERVDGLDPVAVAEAADRAIESARGGKPFLLEVVTERLRGHSVDDPVLFLENLALYNTNGDVPDGDTPAEIGKAAVTREGRDITLIGYSRMAYVASQVAEQLAASDGLDIEVIDLRSLRPLDRETLIDSVKKTHDAVGRRR